MDVLSEFNYEDLAMQREERDKKEREEKEAGLATSDEKGKDNETVEKQATVTDRKSVASRDSVVKPAASFAVRQLTGQLGSVEASSSRRRFAGSHTKSMRSDKSNEINLGSYTAERMEGLEPHDFINKTTKNKRNFFLVLFRMYNELPFQVCMENFAKVYNEVLIKELPSVVTKYALCELQIAELPNLEDCPNDPVNIPFKYNFAQGTSKNLNYTRSPEYMEALKVLCQLVKRQDTMDPGVDLQKRGVRKEPPRNADGSLALGIPLHGREFFFSNVMLKVYQIPMLFMTSSEFMDKPEEGTFIVLVFEKRVAKRMYARNKQQRSRLGKTKKARQEGMAFADEHI